VDVEHRRLDRIAMDDAFTHQLALAAREKGYVRAGAAHVEGDEFGDAGLAGQILRGDDAGAGAGQHGAGGELGRCLDADDAAVGLGEARGNLSPSSRTRVARRLM
jgi:hypothetical protein